MVVTNRGNRKTRKANPFEGVDKQLKSGKVNCGIFWVVKLLEGPPAEHVGGKEVMSEWSAEADRTGRAVGEVGWTTGAIQARTSKNREVRSRMDHLCGY